MFYLTNHYQVMFHICRPLCLVVLDIIYIARLFFFVNTKLYKKAKYLHRKK